MITIRWLASLRPGHSECGWHWHIYSLFSRWFPIWESPAENPWKFRPWKFRPSNLRDLSIKSSLHLHCRQSRTVGRMNLKMLLSGKTGDTEVEHWRTFIFSISSSGCSCGSARRSRGWVQSARLLLLSQIWWLRYPGGNLQGGLWLWL